MSDLTAMLADYRRQLEEDTPRSHAQRQTVRGWDVEFQPDHLLCDSCWELAATALTEAILNRRHGTPTGRVNFAAAGETHGMSAEIKAEANQ